MQATRPEAQCGARHAGPLHGLTRRSKAWPTPQRRARQECCHRPAGTPYLTARDRASRVRRRSTRSALAERNGGRTAGSLAPRRPVHAIGDEIDGGQSWPAAGFVCADDLKAPAQPATRRGRYLDAQTLRPAAGIVARRKQSSRVRGQRTKQSEGHLPGQCGKFSRCEFVC